MTVTYGAAVVSSVGSAVGLNEWVKRAAFSPLMKRVMFKVFILR